MTILSKLNRFLFISSVSLSGILLYYTIKQYRKRLKYSRIPGPKTSGILEFYFGNFNEIIKCLDDGKILSDLFVEWAEKYGPCFKFQFFGRMMVVTNEPQAIKTICVIKNFPKTDFIYSQIGFPYKQRFMGFGLVTDTNEQRWKIRRTLFNPGFHRSVLLKCLKEFNSKTDLLIEKLRTKADGKTMINFYQEINRLTLDIIGTVAFSLNNLDTINHPDNEFSLNISKSFEAVNKYLTDPFFVFNPLNRKKINEYKMTIKKLRNFASEQIITRIKAMENEEYVPNDILTTIINTCKHDKLDLEALIDDFITFFNAGQETTANTLAFVFLELGKNPDVLKRLRQEIDEVLGNRNEINYDDIMNLEFTSCVFKEALRIWPPAPDMFRTSNADFFINEYEIPKNTHLVISPYMCGRNTKYFPDSLEFKPERFFKNLDIEESNVQSYTYFPFSLGPRNCIGQNFAMIESKVLIAKIVQNFDFQLLPNQSYGAVLSTTLRPKDGTLCHLLPRNC